MHRIWQAVLVMLTLGGAIAVNTWRYPIVGQMAAQIPAWEFSLQPKQSDLQTARLSQPLAPPTPARPTPENPNSHALPSGPQASVASGWTESPLASPPQNSSPHQNSPPSPKDSALPTGSTDSSSGAASLASPAASSLPPERNSSGIPLLASGPGDPPGSNSPAKGDTPGLSAQETTTPTNQTTPINSSTTSPPTPSPTAPPPSSPQSVPSQGKERENPSPKQASHTPPQHVETFSGTVSEEKLQKGLPLVPLDQGTASGSGPSGPPHLSSQATSPQEATVGDPSGLPNSPQKYSNTLPQENVAVSSDTPQQRKCTGSVCVVGPPRPRIIQFRTYPSPDPSPPGQHREGLPQEEVNPPLPRAAPPSEETIELLPPVDRPVGGPASQQPRYPWPPGRVPFYPSTSIN